MGDAAPVRRDTFARDHLPPRAQWPDLLPAPASYPQRLNCAAALLDERAVDAGRTAIFSARGDYSYGALRALVDRIAHVLRTDLGLIPGQRVLLRGANTPMAAACLLAIIKAGCIAVPSMPQLRARELAVMLAKARVDAVLCAGALAGELRACGALPAVLYFDAEADGDTGLPSLEALTARHDGPFEAFDTAADDICLIAFTSGTTGEPKATMHFHRDLLAICDAFPRSTLKSLPSDIFIGTPPLAFTFGLGGLLLFPLRAGAATALLEKLTPDLLLGAIARYRATVCFTAPTSYRQMAALIAARESTHDLSSLRRCVSAGEALPPATREAWSRATGLALIDGLGSTEMLHIFISAADDDIRPGATGKPIPGYQACILGADGRPAGPGVTGRLAVKGPTGCRYLDDARQTEYVVDGWNLTGDSYEMDGDGYFYYRARTDDMIISAGYNIAGPEVEEALLRHPLVAECAVIGRADEERGQIVEAHVVLKPVPEPAPDLDDMARILQDFVKGQIAPYKYPRVVCFLPALPRTETGKLQRYKLRRPS